MKKNLDYYQHFSGSDQHPKFKMLRGEFGWAGEGRFWALNNRIAQAEKCKLDVSKKYNKSSIASDLDLTVSDFEKFLLFLLNDCELVRRIENFITTDIIQENYIKVEAEREKARKRANKRWKNLRPKN